MIRATVIVRTPDQCIYFSAIGRSTFEIAEHIVDQFGVCGFTVRALP